MTTATLRQLSTGARFRIDGNSVHLEAGYWDRTSEIESLGLTPVLSSDTTIFGGGQAVLTGRGEPRGRFGLRAGTVTRRGCDKRSVPGTSN